MKKVAFSNKELNRFLLLGDNNTYVIDKMFPLIRAVKRKNYLSVFCTLRIKKETTTIKLGNFPKNSINEIYAKFDVAKKISKNGNNPNYIFTNSENYKGISNNENFDLTFEKLILIFFKKKKLSDKYEMDMKNCIKKFLDLSFFQPIHRINLNIIECKIKNLIVQEKIGTARNFLNYLTTLCNFALKNKFFHDYDSLVLIREKVEKIKVISFKKKLYENKNDYKRIIPKIKKLSKKDYRDLEIFLEKLTKKNERT